MKPTPRLGEAPSQSPLLCGPLSAPAGDDGVACFGVRRPGKSPSLSESPRRRSQSKESTENSDVALPLPPRPGRRSQLLEWACERPTLLLYKSSEAPWRRWSRRSHDGGARRQNPRRSWHRRDTNPPGTLDPWIRQIHGDTRSPAPRQRPGERHRGGERAETTLFLPTAPPPPHRRRQTT
jgi:hypothetical protein